MRYVLITIAIICLIPASLNAQTQALNRIRHLHVMLPSSSGKARVDLLNQLSEAWQHVTAPLPNQSQGQFWHMKIDSVHHYAQMAYEAAEKASYNIGKGLSLINLTAGMFLTWWSSDLYPVPVRTTLLDSMDNTLNSAMSLLDTSAHQALAKLYSLRGDIVLKRTRSDIHGYALNMKESIRQYELANDARSIAENCTWLVLDYVDAGYLNEALDYSLKGLESVNKWIPEDTSADNKWWKNYLNLQTYYNLADISRMGGDYPEALKYLHDANDYALKHGDDWIPCYEICDIYISMGNTDSAMAYQQKCAPKNYNPLNDDALGRIYVMMKEYDKAIPILENVSATIAHRPRIATESACELGKAYAAKGEFKKAQKYAYLALDRANAWGKRAYTMPVYELLSHVHHAMGHEDSAYLYLKRYMMLKDSIQNYQFRWQLMKAQKEGAMALLTKDNVLKTQQLEQRAMQRNALIGILFLLLASGGFIWRNFTLRKRNARLEYSRQQTRMQQQAQELEMKALKAQMNPHFIFNSLSSINWFILKNQTREASDYLTNFSRLIRMVLSNSEKTTISLDDELKMLRIYLDMEQLRLERSFDYQIEMMNNMDASEIHLPPMILQPFCENAIWHGLSHKPGRGLLSINFELDGDILICRIIDDGVGREKAMELESGAMRRDNPMGIQITKTRLSLFNDAHSESEYFAVEDIRNDAGLVAGTKVTLTIKPRSAA